MAPREEAATSVNSAEFALARRHGIKEVAALAEVAGSSVSRVFSQHPNVSVAMRARVLDAASVLGYEPDIRAQSLRTGATMTVGFLVGDISNPLMSEIALGADSTLGRSGYTMLLTNSGGDPKVDAERLKLLRQHRVDGLLLSVAAEDYEGTLRELARTNVPVVLVDRDPAMGNNLSAALSDHASGIRSATSHLLALGHRRIALVNGTTKVRPARERAQALRRACKSVPDAVVTVRSGSFTVEYAERATAALLAFKSRPTAIIAGSNQILIGVLRAVRQAGLRVPADLSIVACDDVAVSEFLTPILATIRRDPTALGGAAAELLLRRLQGGPAAQILLATHFDPAASCGPVPSAASLHRKSQ